VSRIVAAAGLSLVLAGCAGPASTLDPQGPRAAEDARLWWIMFGLGTLVYVGVLGALFFAILRSRRPEQPEPARNGEVMDSNLLIVGGGIVVPLLILPIIWALTLRSIATLASPPTPPQLTIEVIGRQWSYEVRYPEQQITLLNEMRIPTGVPVQVRVASADVIHSFWVPRLMGKIDMVPGRTNESWLEASAPGTYPVECAEYCGLWHARMRMDVIAQPPAEFRDWLASQQSSR
jgi:cytochrome c oxidase subunit 2